MFGCCALCPLLREASEGVRQASEARACEGANRTKCYPARVTEARHNRTNLERAAAPQTVASCDAPKPEAAEYIAILGDSPGALGFSKFRGVSFGFDIFVGLSWQYGGHGLGATHVANARKE